MSIARSLKALFDLDTLRNEEDEQERWRKQFATQDTEGGKEPPPPSLKVDEGTRVFRCKLCGHEDPSARYCPKCLADTMKPV